MRSSNTKMIGAAAVMLAMGGLLLAAVPKPETHAGQGVASKLMDERPIQVSASGLGFEVVWSTIDGGGGTSVGAGGFELSGTIGQPDAGNAGGGAFDLSGGYWARVFVAPTPVCEGDLSGSGVVDADDLGILLGDWGCIGANCAGDVNGDEVVDADDLSILLAAFGNICD